MGEIMVNTCINSRQGKFSGSPQLLTALDKAQLMPLAHTFQQEAVLLSQAFQLFPAPLRQGLQLLLVLSANFLHFTGDASYVFFRS
jgi:hypothetical protein